MRTYVIALIGTVIGSMSFAAGAAQAKVSILVDKDSQTMTVSVDGAQRYQWPVSTGNPSHETPNGTFRTFRMEEDHYSKEFDDAPMPHSIFFTKVGHAMHGTDAEGKLGTPVSHGCVRLSRANATTLYALVEKEGVLTTTVTLTGSSQVALARNPRPAKSNVARRSAPATVADQYAPQYDAAGNPVVPTPQQVAPRRLPPRAQVDDGYIYPADGSSSDARYPSPRRLYEAQGYQQPYQQPQYDDYGRQQYYAPRQQPNYQRGYNQY